MAIIAKKKWYKLIAPPMFNEQEIGETFVAEPEKTIGRTVNANLMVLTSDPKKQNINVSFKISGIDGERLKTAIYSYNLVPSSIKRFIRRGRDRIDDSFICTTADNKNVIIKPLLITRFKANNSVVTALRAGARRFLRDIVSKTNFEDLMKDVVFFKVQSQLKSNLKEVYDLKTCEIRSIEQTTKSKKTRVEELQPEHTEKPEQKQPLREKKEQIKKKEEKEAKGSKEIEKKQPSENSKAVGEGNAETSD